MDETSGGVEASEYELHPLDIIDVQLEPHPNADTLSIQRIGDGYTCVVKTEHWNGIAKAVYIAPDGLVDTRLPQFAFLAPKARSDGWYRVKATKLRSVQSFGLLVPYDGSDLNVRHWQPEEPSGPSVTAKSGRKISLEPPMKGPQYPRYELQNGRKGYKQFLDKGDLVVLSEKLHGSSSAYLNIDGEQLCGSRSGWKRRSLKGVITADYLIEQGVEAERAAEIVAKIENSPRLSWYWSAFDAEPSIARFCEANPGLTLLGEVYGNSVQRGFAYDAGDRVAFRAFDIMRPDFTKLPFHEFALLCDQYSVPRVPVLYAGPFDFEMTLQLAEGKSTLNPATQREGVVVQSLASGVKVKFVGEGYYNRS